MCFVLLSLSLFLNWYIYTIYNEVIIDNWISMCILLPVFCVFFTVSLILGINFFHIHTKFGNGNYKRTLEKYLILLKKNRIKLFYYVNETITHDLSKYQTKGFLIILIEDILKMNIKFKYSTYYQEKCIYFSKSSSHYNVYILISYWEVFKYNENQMTNIIKWNSSQWWKCTLSGKKLEVN
jgi:hypothetical protein